MFNNHSFPGKKTVLSGKELLRAIIQIQSPSEFFKKIYSDRNDFLDFAEDFEPVKAFFAGEQKKIFEDALKMVKIYDDSKTFIVDDKVEETVREIKAILKKDMPYSDIPKLPDLLSQFRDAYMAVLTQMEAPILKAIDDAKERVFEVLNSKPYKDELKDRYFKLFREIHDKATTCNNVATLQNVKIEADALKVRLLNEMAKKDEKVAEETEEYGENGDELWTGLKANKVWP